MLEVRLYRKKWAIFAGKSRLSQLFANEDKANNELDQKRSLYEYWAGSCGVSVENTTPITKLI